MKKVYVLQKTRMGSEIKRLDPDRAYQLALMGNILRADYPFLSLMERDIVTFPKIKKDQEYVFIETAHVFQKKANEKPEFIGVFSYDECGILSFHKFCETYNIKKAKCLDFEQLVDAKVLPEADLFADILNSIRN